MEDILNKSVVNEEIKKGATSNGKEKKEKEEMLDKVKPVKAEEEGRFQNISGRTIMFSGKIIKAGETFVSVESNIQALLDKKLIKKLVFSSI